LRLRVSTIPIRRDIRVNRASVSASGFVTMTRGQFGMHPEQFAAPISTGPVPAGRQDLGPEDQDWPSGLSVAHRVRGWTIHWFDASVQTKVVGERGSSNRFRR